MTNRFKPRPDHAAYIALAVALSSLGTALAALGAAVAALAGTAR